MGAPASNIQLGPDHQDGIQFETLQHRDVAIVHTGQYYDDEMSDVFLRQSGLLPVCLTWAALPRSADIGRDAGL